MQTSGRRANRLLFSEIRQLQEERERDREVTCKKSRAKEKLFLGKESSEPDFSLTGKRSKRRDERYEGDGWQKAVMHGIQKRARGTRLFKAMRL